MVSAYQHAFMEGKLNFDAVLIANEAIDSRLKSNIYRTIIKTDIEKAYYHVNWNFLIAILAKMAFGQK